MCGRYTLTRPGEVGELFEISETRIPPRFNIAPTQTAPALRLDEAGQKVVSLLRWGLVPHWWNKSELPKSPFINARSESVAEKPAFRDPFRFRRCLIPADGFFEWKREGSRKQPFLFRRSDERLFAFAGLWDRNRKEDETIESMTILTCPANRVVGEIHDRMPVILESSDMWEWLEPGSSESELLDLLQPFPADRMAYFPVSRQVNSPRFDNPACIEPLDQPGLFQ